MINHLSAPRANAVKAFFKTKDDCDLMGCYRWSQAVGASLLSVLNDFEVCIRNAIHRSLSQHYGSVDSFDWMGMNSYQGPHSMGGNYNSKVGLRGDIAKAYERASTKTPDGVIAELNFGFWENLINGLTHPSHANGGHHNLMANVLSSAFPHMGTPFDNQFKFRLIQLLKRIRLVRNRLGHHDSLRRVKEFDVNGNEGFWPRRPRQTIVSLKKFLERLTMILGWVEPKLVKRIKKTDYWHSLELLLDVNALGIYKFNGGEGNCILKTEAYVKAIRKNKYKKARSKSMKITSPKEFFYIQKMYS